MNTETDYYNEMIADGYSDTLARSVAKKRVERDRIDFAYTCIGNPSSTDIILILRDLVARVEALEDNV